MGYGKFHPYPRRFGGNRHGGKPVTEIVYESLNAQRGLVFDTDSDTSVAAVENLAHSRAIACDGWELNARIAMQMDPLRTTDMLSRWEKIFAVPVSADATDRARRAVLADRWARFGKIANHARIVTALQDALGSFFVAVEYIDPSIAVVHAPDASYPWGTVVDGVPWYSTVAHILVRLQKPTGASEADFYEAAGKVSQTLDPIVSAFVLFDWYRAPTGGAVVNVSGGPSAAGFYLDQDANLDNNVFDV